jgi:leucyl-tRNA synthetase
MENKYDHIEIEKKWQDKWEKEETFKLEEGSDKEKFYCLDMFPYPSGAGLHVGHPRGYVASDIFSHYKRMRGFNVLHPMGWDAFGLPAENYALKTGVNPRVSTDQNIENFKNQLKIMGLSYDWSKEIKTTDPSYFKWTQWIFLQLFKKGLAYESVMPINWCVSCKTGLANEEVIAGKCERCGAQVVKKDLRQWVLRITKYADRLIEDLDGLDWTSRIKDMQTNWIGRSEGADIDFEIKDLKEKVKVFTTRPDTIFGATFLVLAPEHSLVQSVLSNLENAKEVEKYVEEARKKSDLERTDLAKDKTGVELKGIKAINPVNEEEIPVFVADYVLGFYGYGAIMSVPAHDERDFEFAKKFGLEIKEVIKPVYGDPHEGAEHRNTISAIVHRKKDDKFLALKWNKFGWISPVIGGIEDGESAEEAAIREVLEETGYKTKAVKKLGGEIDSHFYADNKKIWRSRTDQPILLELVEEEPVEVGCEEKEKHEAVWIDSEEILDKITHEDNKIGFLHCLGKECAYVEKGILVNSGEFNGMNSEESKEKIGDWLEKKGLGKKAVNYKLRDWIFSRQRYWGEPIPLVHCDKCGVVPVPEEELPLVLPETDNYTPSESGESPLANIPEWVNTKCPACGGSAKRETNTMPQWAGSCWYYLRFIDPDNDKNLIDPKKEKHFMPVDLYVGGAEHAVLHLLYARFWHKFLYDIGVVSTKEPFQKLSNQGLIMADDGTKMSKSKGNVVSPDDIVKEYGADTFRTFEMFLAPFADSAAWNPKSIVGVRKFLDKIWDLKLRVSDEADNSLDQITHQTIKKVTEDLEDFKFNTAISALMILVNEMKTKESIGKENYISVLKMIAPFAPHLSEEIYSEFKDKNILKSEWPSFDEKLIIEDEAKIVIQINGKMRDSLTVKAGSSEDEVKELALALDNISKWVEGKDIKKVIYVQDKILNIVV